MIAALSQIDGVNGGLKRLNGQFGKADGVAIEGRKFLQQMMKDAQEVTSACMCRIACTWQSVRGQSCTRRSSVHTVRGWDTESPSGMADS